MTFKTLDTMATHFIWNINPVLFSMGPLEIRWYGLFFAAAFLLGQAYLARRLKQSKGAPPRAVDLDALLIWIALGTLAGARLAHCLFYEPGYYLFHPLEIPMLWKGGLASHGGAAGFLLALFFFTQKKRLPFLFLADRLTVPAALGGAMVRLGNFFNSEIVGTPSKALWAVIFPRVDLLPRHPVQLYESLFYATTAGLLFMIDKKTAAEKAPGRLTALFFATVFSGRFLLEFFKTSQAPWLKGFPLSAGQILSVPVIAFGIILCLFSFQEKNTP